MGMIQNATQKNEAVANVGTKPTTMQGYIKQMEKEIAKALPSVITPERFTRIVLSALSTNPKLGMCTPQSFLGAMMTAAQLGLEPNTPLGQAYLIPFKNGKAGVLECQFQLGYKGLMDLAYRSGEVKIIQAHVVYANDEFEYSLGLEPVLKHRPAQKDRGNPTHVYAMFRTKDDGYGFTVMSMEEVRAHAARYSKSFGNGPWQTNFEEMAKKTVLKRVLKYAPLKSDFIRGISCDGTVKSELNEDMYTAPTTYIDVDADNYDEIPVDHTTGEVVQE